MTRRFYKLVDDMSSPDRWHLSQIFTANGAEVFLDVARRVDPPEELVTKIHKAGPAFEYTQTSFGIPVTTEKLAAAIAEVAGKDVQCLPLTVTGHGKMVALNALRAVECLDEGHSRFSRWSGTEPSYRPERAGSYKGVTKIVIDPGRVPTDAHFFQLGGWEVVLIVSDTMKAAMERAGCRGAVFQDVNPPTQRSRPARPRASRPS